MSASTYMDAGREDDDHKHRLEIPEEERETLLAETEKYLAELRAEVGEPSE